MMLLRTVSLALGLLFGIVAATSFGAVLSLPFLFLSSLCAVCVSVVLFIRERKWVVPAAPLVMAAAVMSTFSLGYWRAWKQVGPAETGSLRHTLESMEDGSALALRGRICKEPEQRGEMQGDLKLNVDYVKIGDASEWTPVRAGKVLVRVYTSGRSGAGSIRLFNQLMHPQAYGYSADIYTKYSSPEPPKNPGEFNPELYLLQNGLLARFRCQVSRVRIAEESFGNVLTEVALAAKHRFLVTYRNTIRNPASRLVAASTLGVRRAVENTEYGGKEIAETFRHAGVGHVLAVSGLHVSVVSLLFFWMFLATGIRPKVFVPIQIVFLILFALLTGARPSSTRAVIMNSVILIAFAYARCDLKRATCIGLAISALLVLSVNPIVLYAPSFLLSYGAVLSLVLIAPVVDRWLCLLRGFSLMFFVVWFLSLLMCLACCPWVFLDGLHCLGFAGLLWLGITIGGRLNSRVPSLWGISLANVPPIGRLFFSAQIAIQIGMMIPLSAWFFGRFPGAGILVNLLAIPAIGVLVQLGILTGLLGLTPLAGLYLALPFGIAATLVGEFFFFLAYFGSALFPFPATPKPTTQWMLCYYLVVFAVLSVESWHIAAQDLLYRFWKQLKNQTALSRLALVAPCVLLIMPVIGHIPRPKLCETITCCATRRYPIVTLVSRDKSGILINAGDEFEGGRILFEVLRSQGATSLESALLCSPDPRAGNEGLAELSRKMRVSECLVPVAVEHENLYLEAIGDAYLAQQAKEGERWASNYIDAYGRLLESLADTGTAIKPLTGTSIVRWDNLSIDALPMVTPLPARFVSSAITVPLLVEIGDFKWLIITDGVQESLKATLAESGRPCDVVVLPELSYRKDYRELLDVSVSAVQPQVVIVSGDRVPRTFDIDAWASEHGIELMATGRDGAVEATLTQKGTMEIKGTLSGKTITVLPSGPK